MIFVVEREIGVGVLSETSFSDADRQEASDYRLKVELQYLRDGKMDTHQVCTFQGLDRETVARAIGPVWFPSNLPS